MKSNIIIFFGRYKKLLYYKFSSIKRHYKKQKTKIRHQICSYLIPDDFTIISDDCIGGAIYQYFGKKYSSPTIGLWISQPDYLNFIKKIQNISSFDITFKKLKEFDYPVGMIDEIRIGFQHYKTELEAKTKWEERCKRINYSNLFLKIDFRYPWYTKKDIDSWNSMKPKKSIAIINKDTTNKYGKIHNSICLKSKQEYNNTRKELMQKLVFWEWLNKNVIKEPNFVERIILKLISFL